MSIRREATFAAAKLFYLGNDKKVINHIERDYGVRLTDAELERARRRHENMRGKDAFYNRQYAPRAGRNDDDERAGRMERIAARNATDHLAEAIAWYKGRHYA